MKHQYESKYSKMVIIHFFQVPASGFFRYQKEFWQRVGQNHALPARGVDGSIRFDTVTPVGISVEDLPQGVKPLSL